MDTTYFDVWSQASGSSLVSIPVGPAGLAVYTVPSGKQLIVTSLTLWIEPDALQPTPSVAVQREEQGLDPVERGNVLLWRSSSGDRRLSLTGLALKFLAGNKVVLRTAGQPSPDPAPKVGYSFQAFLVDA